MNKAVLLNRAHTVFFLVGGKKKKSHPVFWLQSFSVTDRKSPFKSTSKRCLIIICESIIDKDRKNCWHGEEITSVIVWTSFILHDPQCNLQPTLPRPAAVRVLLLSARVYALNLDQRQNIARACQTGSWHELSVRLFPVTATSWISLTR